ASSAREKRLRRRHGASRSAYRVIRRDPPWFPAALGTRWVRTAGKLPPAAPPGRRTVFLLIQPGIIAIRTYRRQGRPAITPLPSPLPFRKRRRNTLTGTAIL